MAVLEFVAKIINVKYVTRNPERMICFFSIIYIAPKKRENEKAGNTKIRWLAKNASQLLGPEYRRLPSVCDTWVKKK